MSKKEISSGTEKAEALTRKKSGVKSQSTEGAKSKTPEKKTVKKTVKSEKPSAPVKQDKKEKGAKPVKIGDDEMIFRIPQGLISLVGEQLKVKELTEDCVSITGRITDLAVKDL